MQRLFRRFKFTHDLLLAAAFLTCNFFPNACWRSWAINRFLWNSCQIKLCQGIQNDGMAFVAAISLDNLFVQCQQPHRSCQHGRMAIELPTCWESACISHHGFLYWSSYPQVCYLLLCKLKCIEHAPSASSCLWMLVIVSKQADHILARLWKSMGCCLLDAIYAWDQR